MKNLRKDIKINQLGYRLKDRKAALFSYQGGKFEVVNEETDQVVYQGVTEEHGFDEASGELVFIGDFSKLTEPGLYKIRLMNQAESYPFVIQDQPYKALHKGTLKAFYYYRCGMELEEVYAGEWTHKACHLQHGIVYDQENRHLDSSGGWHDAGDYGKYVGPGAKAAVDLMLAYEFYPQVFTEATPIPETDGIMADVLHEVRYELNWLFKMQDPVSNGVFHKLTTKQFPSFLTLPEQDTEELYFSPISATATGCFAGVMAMAARVYRVFDAEFAAQCLEAAIRAWHWLEQNPNVPGFKNPTDIATGEYGDRNDQDERYWAAAELYRTTGEEGYSLAFEVSLKQDFNRYSLGWSDMGGYGTLAYLMTANKDSELHKMLKKGLLDQANQYVMQSAEEGYGISLTSKEYIWGSNMLVMNRAMLLLIADFFKQNNSYVRVALDHLHYLLGRNAMNMSYVTGFGANAVLNPHYRPSMAMSNVNPVPGLVSGGPASGLMDDYAAKVLQDQPPAKSFVDHHKSYSTNEVTIYWNSPVVFVVSHFIGE